MYGEDTGLSLQDPETLAADVLAVGILHLNRPIPSEAMRLLQAACHSQVCLAANWCWVLP